MDPFDDRWTNFRTICSYEYWIYPLRLWSTGAGQSWIHLTGVFLLHLQCWREDIITWWPTRISGAKTLSWMCLIFFCTLCVHIFKHLWKSHFQTPKLRWTGDVFKLNAKKVLYLTLSYNGIMNLNMFVSSEVALVAIPSLLFPITSSHTSKSHYNLLTHLKISLFWASFPFNFTDGVWRTGTGNSL